MSQHLLETALPEDKDELSAACGATATGGGGADAKGTREENNRSVVDTANRLAQLKSGVLGPMLNQALADKVVR